MPEAHISLSGFDGEMSLMVTILQVEEVEAVVHGSIPEWLSGCLIMNGGGDYSHMRHLFGGYALLSKVRIAATLSILLVLSCWFQWLDFGCQVVGCQVVSPNGASSYPQSKCKLRNSSLF
jgi:hypothetical protein